MKPTTKNLLLSAISGIGLLCCGCQEKATETPSEETGNTEISNHLDLEVVISLFGESENLEDFEKKLNEPERQISNLDLNEDGEVDYLRVVESSMDKTHLVSVQAVIGEDQYQDVATFDVEQDQQGQTQVQVVGDPYLYGPNYVIRPSYAAPPLILAWFAGASYSSWRSPYRWGHYPSYYRPWNPYPYNDYRRRVAQYRNPNYKYQYGSSYKRNKNSISLYNDSKRYDYASKHPNKSFKKRNKGVENRYQLEQKKGKNKGKVANTKGPVSTQRPAAKPPKPSNKPASRPTTKPATKPSKPATKPSKPATKPSKPASKPSKPAAKPSKPASKPSKPAAKPSKPASKPSKPAAKPSKPASKPSKPASKPSKPASKPSGKSGGKK